MALISPATAPCVSFLESVRNSPKILCTCARVKNANTVSDNIGFLLLKFLGGKGCERARLIASMWTRPCFYFERKVLGSSCEESKNIFLAGPMDGKQAFGFGKIVKWAMAIFDEWAMTIGFNSPIRFGLLWICHWACYGLKNLLQYWAS